MVGIDIDARVDRIQKPEDLLFNKRVSDQYKLCQAAGCSERFFMYGNTGSPFSYPGKIVTHPPSDFNNEFPSHPAGLPEFRNVVSDFYNHHYHLAVNPERIILGHGIKGLIFSLFTLLSGSVVVPTPGWLGYLPHLRILNKPYYRLYGHRAANYKISPIQLVGLLKGLVKSQHVLILQNPGYPTGVLYRRNELEEIADICRTYNTLVLANETAGLFTYDQSEFVSMGSVYPEGTFVLNNLSIDRETEGYQIGSCIIPEDCNTKIIDEYYKIITTINNTIAFPVQQEAIRIFQSHNDINEFLLETRAIYRIMTRRLSSLCAEIEGVRTTIPEGGFSFMADLNGISDLLQNAGIRYSNDLAAVLIKHPYHIATVSGEMMMAAYNDFFIRFSVNDFDGLSALNDFHKNKPGTEYQEREFFEKHGARMITGMNMFRNWIQDLKK